MTHSNVRTYILRGLLFATVTLSIISASPTFAAWGASGGGTGGG